ncbi:hypothetical protein FACS189415_4070 [Bacteroidia bacterium]|nr:hypothetical protein FACS189415_4070 [Bacteroidia bacterium]
MQKHFEASKLAVEKKNIREQFRSTVAKAMREAKSMNDFRLLLKKKNIGVVFRQNEAERIYGITFIDYPNRAVLNGSRLGKKFSANVFNDLFNSPNRQATESKQNIIINEPKWTEHIQHTNFDSALGSVFGILDMPQSGNDYEEENFIREQKRKRKKKPQKKRGRGI